MTGALKPFVAGFDAEAFACVVGTPGPVYDGVTPGTAGAGVETGLTVTGWDTVGCCEYEAGELEL